MVANNRLAAVVLATAMASTTLIAPYTASVASADDASVLFISGNAAKPSIHDRHLIEVIEAEGVTVQVADDDTVVATDAQSVDGVVIE